MDHSKTLHFQDNIFTDPTSLDDPFLQSPLQSNLRSDKEMLPVSSESKIEYDLLTSMKFYDEYKKIYSVSYQLHIQKIKLAAKVQQIERKIAAVRLNEVSSKKYKCQVEECHRLYGNKEALQQHRKSKHPHQISSTIDQVKYEHAVDSC